MAEQFTLKNNLIFVLAEAAGGVYNSDQMRTLCEVADNESAFLKITEDQRIGFMLDPNKLPEIQSQVRKCGIILKAYKAAGVPSPRACLGELCSYSQQPSLGDALELTTHLLKSFPSPKRHSTIAINGCGRACLGSSTEDVHVVAEDSGYKVSIGGKGSEIPQQAQLLVENVPRTELPLVLERLLAVFYLESTEDERIYDVIERIGLTPFLNALPEHLMPAMHESGEDEAQDAIPEAVSASDEEPITDAVEIAESELDALLPEASDSDTSGLVEANETLLIDELMEENSSKTEDGMVTQADDFDNAFEDQDSHEPAVDIDPMLVVEDFEEQEELSETDSDEALPEADLLEDADYEDGTLDDVSRIREAIRTELSMSVTESEKLAEGPMDLLDEIDADSQPVIAAENEAEQDSNPEGDELLLDQENDFVAEDMQYNEGSIEAIESDHPRILDEATQSDFPMANASSGKRRDSKVSSAFQYEAQATALNASQKVQGRLSIRFLEQQLAVELPSGMCFELPMDAVQEGSQFSMELPDGELIMERQGATLLVRLGLLQMKFPIPSDTTRRVA